MSSKLFAVKQLLQKTADVTVEVNINLKFHNQLGIQLVIKKKNKWRNSPNFFIPKLTNLTTHHLLCL